MYNKHIAPQYYSVCKHQMHPWLVSVQAKPEVLCVLCNSLSELHPRPGTFKSAQGQCNSSARSAFLLVIGPRNKSLCLKRMKLQSLNLKGRKIKDLSLLWVTLLQRGETELASPIHSPLKLQHCVIFVCFLFLVFFWRGPHHIGMVGLKLATETQLVQWPSTSSAS